MGELKAFPRGQAIIRRGEVSSAMFVMISGRAEVRVNEAGQSRPLWEVHRGDVFGVTSLMRSEERLTEVVALEDVEVGRTFSRPGVALPAHRGASLF
jgi:CRP-like cAMP-binding protein